MVGISMPTPQANFHAFRRSVSEPLSKALSQPVATRIVADSSAEAD
jgi:hypothetical protein